ncbi:15-cis-phytoene synthase [Tepidimonas alkaliphilus]|uniref:15-cis-phytoene synthase n=1 Tax=Tepidimonas alkaliphilus TaxID=2588942 RepID=A0A554W415_9BURK|nr:squalene synthase HpnC [Tepidimonas alkaliphilus]TSE18314.1 15-cis-phytoene synthase [Tepidimonas alkaliphilus]
MGLAHAVDHYENFPVASLLCPPRWRGAVVALYGLARWADDVADEGDRPAAQRLALLRRLRAELQREPAGPAADDAPWGARVRDWHAARRRHGLPLQPVLDLLDAFEQDVRWTAQRRRMADEAELLDYCRRSANPVGRLMLHLAGVRDPRAQAESDAVCTALQLINCWQDLGVDEARGRRYLPDAWLRRHGLNPQRPLTDHDAEALTPVVRHGCAVARAALARGWDLPRRVGGRFGWELRLVLQGGLRVLQRVEALGGRVLAQRPRLRGADVPLLLWRALAHRPPAVRDELVC